MGCRLKLHCEEMRATCSSEPSFVVVNEMCSLPITISSSCRPTRSGIGQLLSSSFISCACHERDVSIGTPFNLRLAWVTMAQSWAH